MLSQVIGDSLLSEDKFLINIQFRYVIQKVGCNEGDLLYISTKSMLDFRNKVNIRIKLYSKHF